MITDLRELFDPATRPNPYPVYTRLREAGPQLLHEGALVVLAGYDQCRQVLLHPNASSGRGPVPAPGRRTVPPSFLSMDPPDHTRLRRLVSKAFTPRVVAALEPKITELVDESLAAVAGTGSMDVVSEFAGPVPVRIIGELLGVPEEDHERLRHWSRLMVRALDPVRLAPVSEQEAAQMDTAREELTEYFRRLIERRRHCLGADLLSGLVRIEEQGDQLSADELLSTCVLLLVAGHETTANVIAHAVLALLRNPAELAALRADPSRASAVVEETLRYDPPLQMVARQAKGPIRVDGCEIAEGSTAMLLLAAANRDPAVHTAPDRFAPGRGNTGHLTFGAGAHFCLGAPLARLEAAIALTAFAKRVCEPVLDESSLRYKPHITVRGPERFVVRFDGVD